MAKGDYSSSEEESEFKRKHHKKKHYSRMDERKARKQRSYSRSRSRSPNSHRVKSEPGSSPHRKIKKEKHDYEGSRSRQHDMYDPNRPIKKEPEDRPIKQEHYDRMARNERARDDFSEQRRDRRRNDERRRNARRERGSNPFDDSNQEFAYGGEGASGSNKDTKTKEKEKPDFGLSGKLTEDTNTYRGVVIKYNQPAEARKPKTRWRLYPFKGEEVLPMLHIHRMSAYLIGRDRVVVDIPVDHPSCSKQHAVLQYRLVEYQRDDGSVGRRVRPYIIDLNSSNGTFVNNKKVEPQRYVELMEKDVIKFGYSTREYVLLHEKSNTAEVDDGVISD